jgi:hypothetical protein
MVSKLPDMLNAEIVLGNVQNAKVGEGSALGTSCLSLVLQETEVSEVGWSLLCCGQQCPPCTYILFSVNSLVLLQTAPLIFKVFKRTVFLLMKCCKHSEDNIIYILIVGN